MKIQFVAASLALLLVRGGLTQDFVKKELGDSQFIRWELAGTGWVKGQFVNGDWWVVVPIGQTLTVTGTVFSEHSQPYEYSALSIAAWPQPKARLPAAPGAAVRAMAACLLGHLARRESSRRARIPGTRCPMALQAPRCAAVR